MKKISLLFIFVFFFTQSVFAGKPMNSNDIGIADFDLLVALHPDMADYDPAQKAFVSKDKNAVLENERIEKEEQALKKLNKQNEAYRKSFDKYKEEYDALVQEEAEKFRRRIYGLVATASILYEDEVYRNAINKLKNKYQPKLDYYSACMAEGSAAYNDRKYRTGIKGYTSYDTTQQRLKSIVSDVQKAVKSAAKQEKLTLVFNSSSIASHVRTKDQTDSESISFYNGCNVNDYKTLLNGEMIKRAMSNCPENSTYEKEIMYSAYNIVNTQALKQIQIKHSWSQLLPNSSILLGGTDITQQALKILLKRNGVNNSNSGIILKMVSKFMSKGLTEGEF